VSAGAPGGTIKLRRSPHLVGYWTDAGPILENYATGRRAPGAPIVHTVLGVFSQWRSPAAATSALPDAEPSLVRRIVKTLVELTFLQRSDRPAAGIEDRLDAWRAWGPATGFFHCATRDIAFSGDLHAMARTMRAKARREPMPPVIKHYRGAPTLALPAPRTGGAFPAVVRSRRTWRRFGTNPASMTDLSDVLCLTFGVQRWMDLPGIGRVALKSSPWGGARHPIECFVVALRVAGLARGIYHYRPDSHRLERLRARAAPRDVRAFLPGQPWFAGASAVVLMTAVFARTQWRYPTGRAYRVILAEAGHLGQTFCLAASWRGLAPFCTMALADSRIERSLGLDGGSEAVLYAAGFGTRPAGVAWAPWPDAGGAQKRPGRADPSATRRARASA
jgi:SagB-type dehydrogenase family enzyme